MKKYLSAFFLFAFSYSYAQIPQPGMESWSASSAFTPVENPTGWASANILLSSANDTSVNKVTYKNGGSFAAKIQTVVITNPPFPLPNDTLGILFTGVVTFTSPYINYGFPQTTRESKLYFNYDYRPMPGDSAFIWVVFENNSDTIGQGRLTLGATTSQYTLDSVAIIYDPQFPVTMQPTKATIYCSSSRLDAPRIGSVLYVDDFSFTAPSSINELTLKHGVKAYPTLAKNIVYFSSRTAELKQVHVFDVTGKLINKLSFNEKGELNVLEYASGLYIYQVTDENNKHIATGKFSVVR